MKPRYLKHNPKVVALVGMGPSITSLLTECLTQEFKPDWADEIWAVNMASNALYCDVIFWMDDIDEQEKFRPGLFSVLRRRNKPVITSKSNREILPKSYDYPIQEIAQLSLPIFGKIYFNNAVAQAIAYAIWKKVEVLKLYGCDFTYPDRTYAESGRACTEAWLALASASGLDVRVPDRTSLLDAVEPNKGVYGYRDQPLIALPNGGFYRPGGSASGEYIPEDTRKKDELPGSVPGAEGGSAKGSGKSGRGANGAKAVAPPAAPRSGDSVQHQAQ